MMTTVFLVLKLEDNLGNNQPRISDFFLAVITCEVGLICLLGFIFYRLVIMVSNNSCDNCRKLRMGLADLILDYNKIKEELNELQEFKKRHDEQLSRLLCSPSDDRVSG